MILRKLLVLHRLALCCSYHSVRPALVANRRLVRAALTRDQPTVFVGNAQDLAAALREALESGGTDGVGDLIASAALPSDEAGAPTSVPHALVLDTFEARDWCTVVNSAFSAGNGRENTLAHSGSAASCFNVILSELGLPPKDLSGTSSRGGPLPATSWTDIAEISPAEVSVIIEDGAAQVPRVSPFRGRVAQELIEAMLDKALGCQPDVVSFSCATCACRAAGDEDGAEALLARALAGPKRSKQPRARRVKGSGKKKLCG